MPGNLTASGVVDAHVVAWTSNPHAWAETASVLFTGVTSVTMVSDGSAVNVSADVTGSTPMVISLPVAPSVDTNTFRCSYWDPASATWTDRGTVLLGFDVDGTTGNTFAVCGTLHLTDFTAVKKSTAFFQTNSIDLGSDAGLLTAAFDPSNLAPTLVVVGLVVVFFVAWLVSFKVRVVLARCDGAVTRFLLCVYLWFLYPLCAHMGTDAVAQWL